MKRVILLILIVVLTVPIVSQAGIIGPASIRFVEGDVMFRTPDDDEWLPASINTPLDEGDAVWCPDGSRVEIQLPDGSMLRMDEGSQLDMVANEDGFSHVHLASGRLYLRTAQTSGKDSLQIDADDTTVLPAARTRLRLDMLPNSQEDVAIFKGSAYVEGNGSRTRVRAGEHIALEDGHSELLPLNPSDNWEHWNLERDRAQSRSAKLDSNLPDELRSHSAELDSNGSWVRVPEYGMVWQPTVIVSSDWAPYRTGRWIWKGDDYIWISYESWGWVPYHYGRWAVVSGFGWCWVPPARGDVYWGPGYVGWYSTGSHVGWTPLAPGEIFYGRRYYGRQSAIITNLNINTTKVVYRNQRHPGGFTVVQQNDFQRGRTIFQQPARTPSLSVSVSIGAPRIKPVRESRMPIIKQTPPRAVPPRFEQRDHRDLQSRFPRITTEPNREHGRRQQQPVVTQPAPQPSQPAPVREKRTVFPVAEPREKNGRPATQPVEIPRTRDDNRSRSVIQPQPVPTVSGTAPQRPDQPQPKREESRQRPEAAQTRQQPVFPAPATTPQRQEQPRRETIPTVIVPPPATTPQPQQERVKREEQRQQRPPVQQPSAQPVPTPPQRIEPPKAVPAPPVAVPREAARQRGERPAGEIKEKKVWKVTTPDSPNDKENKDRGRRER